MKVRFAKRFVASCSSRDNRPFRVKWFRPVTIDALWRVQSIVDSQLPVWIASRPIGLISPKVSFIIVWFLQPFAQCRYWISSALAVLHVLCLSRLVTIATLALRLSVRELWSFQNPFNAPNPFPFNHSFVNVVLHFHNAFFSVLSYFIKRNLVVYLAFAK